MRAMEFRQRTIVSFFKSCEAISLLLKKKIKSKTWTIGERNRYEMCEYCCLRAQLQKRLKLYTRYSLCLDVRIRIQRYPNDINRKSIICEILHGKPSVNFDNPSKNRYRDMFIDLRSVNFWTTDVFFFFLKLFPWAFKKKKKSSDGCLNVISSSRHVPTFVFHSESLEHVVPIIYQ